MGGGGLGYDEIVDMRGGGATLIFSYIRRLGPFFGVQNYEFRYFETIFHGNGRNMTNGKEFH